MTNKQRTIEACKQLADKYRKPKSEKFFGSNSCSLCNIFYTTNDTDCISCPLATMGGRMGCIDFYTYRRASSVGTSRFNLICKPFLYPDNAVIIPEFLARAAFFDKIIPILQEIPARRFTRSGWTYFNELDRNW